jgi:hypothetical protein
MTVFPPGDAALEKIPIYVTSSGSRRLNPSPAAYEPAKPFGYETVPIHIHNRLRDGPADEGPAPGEYESTSDFGDGRKGCQFLGPKDRSPYDLNSNPGPANYDTPGSALPPKITIGSPVKPLRPDEVPGPGQYDPAVSRPPGGQIHEGTHSPYDISSNPGPGNYETAGSTLPSKITIGQTTKPLKQDEVPGPGEYNPDAARDRSCQIHEGVHAPYDIRPNPGPADYAPPDTPLPTPIIIGNVISPLHEDETPPPGAYDEPRAMRPSPTRGQIHGRPRSRAGSSTHRLGADYVPPPFGRGAAKVTISLKSQPQRKDEVPAPGSYNPQKPFGSGTSSPRFRPPAPRSHSSLSDHPGPGAYSPDSSVARAQSKGVTIGSSRKEPKRDQTPDYYNVKGSLGGPRYSMRSRSRLEIVYG